MLATHTPGWPGRRAQLLLPSIITTLLSLLYCQSFEGGFGCSKSSPVTLMCRQLGALFVDSNNNNRSA